MNVYFPGMAIMDTPYYIRPLQQSKNSSQTQQVGDIISIQPGVPFKSTLVTGNIRKYCLAQFTIDYFSLQTRFPIEIITTNALKETLILFNAGGLISIGSTILKPVGVPRYCYWIGESNEVQLSVGIPNKCGVEFLLLRQTPQQLKQWIANKIEVNLLPEQIVLLTLAGHGRVVVQSMEKRRSLAMIMDSLADHSAETHDWYDLLNWLLVTCWQRSWQHDVFRLADANLPGDVFRIYQAAEGLIMAMEQEFSLRLFSKKVGMNSNLIQAQFKVIFGCSVFRFLVQIRMAKAVYLLQVTDQSIDRVGFLVGYPNAAHFATVFKKYTGSSPSEVRNSHIKYMGSFTE